jgi:hypothetical protein
VPDDRGRGFGAGGDEQIGDLDASVVQAASLGQRPLHLECALDLIRATRELMEGLKFLAEPVVA